MGGHRKPILEPHRAFIAERISQTPHLTLHGLKDELAARGREGLAPRGVDVPATRGSELQKKHCSPLSRAAPTSRGGGSAGDSLTGSASIHSRLVFIDETWAKTNMTRTHGAAAPPQARGWWRPLTAWPLAFADLPGRALRCDRMRYYLRHRRTDQRRKLPRLCRAVTPADA